MIGSESVYIVDNDLTAATAMARLFESVNIEPRIFDLPVEFLRSFSPDKPSCLVLEMRMPKLSGLELLTRLKQRGSRVPAIIVTAHADVTSAVRAMKLGAVEFMEKPVNDDLLLECVQYWIGMHRADIEFMKKRAVMEEKLAKLSTREREVLNGVLNGMSNKEIARELGVSPKAIELYRSKLMAKMAAPSLAVLIRETLSYELQPETPYRRPVLQAARPVRGVGLERQQNSEVAPGVAMEILPAESVSYRLPQERVR